MTGLWRKLGGFYEAENVEGKAALRSIF